MMAATKSTIIAISGCSSSGKTTLSRLLRDIWPNTYILHEDDFYWPDDKIPFKDGVQDWDCLEAIDLDKLQRSIEYIRDHGALPADLESKEDQNSVGDCDVQAATVAHWKQMAAEKVKPGAKPIFIIDGFLLYSEGMAAVRELMDIKLFLRTSFATAKARREARSGYVTIDGFWEDPPGYVEKIVWPNYVKDHAFLFQNDDVEDEVNDQVCTALHIDVMPRKAEGDMTAVLQWASEIIYRYRAMEGQ